METLVVHFHPLAESYTEALLDATVEGLGGVGVEPVVVRLGRGQTIADTQLAAAEHLVFVAPTWWGAMPSPILAWIQSTLGPWIDGDADRASSPLRAVRRLTVVTSHGSSRLVNTLQGEPGRQLWRRVVLGLCAPEADFDWVALYKIDRLDEPARRAFLDEVRSRLATATATATATSGGGLA